MRPISKSGVITGTVATLLPLQLILLRVIASASMDKVYLAGRELHWDCAFREHFGIPCPNCGMTRSLLLTLHGNLGAALQLNPGGPLLVAGMLLFSGMLFYLMRRQQAPTGPSLPDLQRKIGLWMSAYGAFFVAVVMLHWVREVLIH